MDNKNSSLNEQLEKALSDDSSTLKVGKMEDIPSILESALGINKQQFVRLLIGGIILIAINLSASIVSFFKHNESKHNRSDLTCRMTDMEDKLYKLEEYVAE